jgi:DNA-binding beta-propeller fold protein YncE
MATASLARAQEPTFVRRLSLPVSGDAIGYARGVTADPHANEVFVCDTRGNRILVFDSEGLFVYEISGGDVFTAPRDIAIDPEGYLVTLAGHAGRQAILELDFDGLFLREIVLSGLPEGVAEPHLSSLALSTAGDRLYALDSRNNRLWILDRSGDVEGSVDLAADYSEKEARDLIFGHVDVYGDTVLVAIPSFSQIRAFAPDGQATGSVGKRGTAPCTLAFPTAAALTEDGTLLIVDQQRMVVLRWSLDANRCLGEHLGIGAAPGFLYYPLDLALDRSGQMYVAQGYEGRVQMYDGMPPATAPPAPR